MVNKKSRGSARTGQTQRNYQQYRPGRRFSEKKMGFVTKTTRLSENEFSKQKGEGKFAIFDLKSVENTALGQQRQEGIKLGAVAGPLEPWNRLVAKYPCHLSQRNFSEKCSVIVWVYILYPSCKIFTY